VFFLFASFSLPPSTPPPLPYVAGWGENGGLEAVSEFARTIDAVARRSEDAIGQPADGAA
jgi:hypothetical protein